MRFQQRMRFACHGRGPWNKDALAKLMVVLSAVCCPLGDSGAMTIDEPPLAAKAGPSEAEAASARLSYSGRVIEKGTAKPVTDATVTVSRLVWPDPATGGRRILQETKHRTDALGTYRFTTTPEQMAEPQLAVFVRVEHPDYAADDAYYYGFGNIPRDEAHGERNSFEIELSPGKSIVGVVETPDGKPAADVLVRSFSYISTKNNTGDLVLGFLANTQTDDRGRFRLVVLTPGIVELKLYPAEFAVAVRDLNETERGDIGRIVLNEGVTLSGKVVDADGTPLAGVLVNAAGYPKEPVTDELFDESHWGGLSSYSRSTVTGPKGEFTLAPLPAGFYRVIPVREDRDGMTAEDFRPVRAPFSPLRVRVKDGETPRPLEIRALPHIVIGARFHDSKGTPRQGPPFFLVGMIDIKDQGHVNDAQPGILPKLLGSDNAQWWTGMAWPDSNGKIQFHAPRGLQNAMIDVGYVTDEHHALRYRIGTNGPLRADVQMKLETTADDINAIEIICYDSPTVLVRIKAGDGSKPPGARVTAIYPEGRNADAAQAAIEDSQRPRVAFCDQADGRFRSLRLLPDEKVTVTASADGFRPRSETLTLPERAVKELELILDRE